VAVLVVLSSACTSGSPTTEPSQPALSSHTGSPSASPTETASFERTCETAVYGGISDWHSHSVIVGPLAFPWLTYLATASPRTFLLHHGSYHALKELAVVQLGQTVTVSIPLREQPFVSLVYNPSDLGASRISDGEAQVVLHACPGASKNWNKATQFNGGFMVAGARCAVLEVSTGSAAPRRVVVAFGKGRCRPR
jgi:hypothetical protein